MDDPISAALTTLQTQSTVAHCIVPAWHGGAGPKSPRSVIRPTRPRFAPGLFFVETRAALLAGSNQLKNAPAIGGRGEGTTMPGGLTHDTLF